MWLTIAILNNNKVAKITVSKFHCISDAQTKNKKQQHNNNKKNRHLLLTVPSKFFVKIALTAIYSNLIPLPGLI